MKATINVQLKLEENVFDISLDIPSSAPTDEAPYLFLVKDGSSTEEEKPSLLELAVGDVKKSHFYVGVEPPQSLYPQKMKEVVKELRVVACEGTYKTKEHKFASE